VESPYVATWAITGRRSKKIECFPKRKIGGVDTNVYLRKILKKKKIRNGL